MRGFSTTRLFILLILVTAIAFGIRSRDMYQGYLESKSTKPQAQAEVTEEEDVTVANSAIRDLRSSFSTSRRLAKIEPAASEEHGDDHAADGEMHADDGMEGDEEGESELGAPPMVGEGTEWRDVLDDDIQYSESRLKILEDLNDRRKILDGKEKELAVREALLQAAERELDQKYDELELLKTEIEQLLGKQSEEEEKRIQSLVKIYEGMKAKQAATIFNTLDTDVLLSVLGRMSERKSAPIIAAMDPSRARSVTILLAEQKSLPNLSAQ